MHEVERVSVGDDVVEALRDASGQVWVVARRVCDALGLNADGQRVKLLGKTWACTEMISVVDGAGRSRPTFCVSLNTLPMWLAGIDAGKVDDAVAKKLWRFQTEARDVLAAHFLGTPSPAASSSVGSGSPVGSGRPFAAPTTALQMLELCGHLSGAIKATLDEVAAVNARVDEAARVVARIDSAFAVVSSQAEAAAVAADRVSREGAQFREHRRRLDAATAHMTRQIRRHATDTGVHWQLLYSSLRNEFGLRKSTQPGGVPLGKAKLRADQVLRMSRWCVANGVPGCSQRAIEAILNGDVGAPVVDMPTSALTGTVQ